MTADERQQIRMARDEAVRAGLRAEQLRRNNNSGRCLGCGCPVDERTEECGTCRERHKRRQFREQAAA